MDCVMISGESLLTTTAGIVDSIKTRIRITARTMLQHATLFVLYLISVTVSQIYAPWPYYMGPRPSYDSQGNAYVGQRDAGIFLTCNGIGCPVRG
uniref:Secreted protein n=1 Tax=Heterorhabditis bacteriophora TaxID=37862 RepID=A0A1I7X4F7_HETBA